MMFAHLEPIQAKAEGTFAGSTRRSGAGRGLPCAAKPRTSCNPRCRLLQRRVEAGDHRAHIRRPPTEPRAWASATWRARARRLAIGGQRVVVTTSRTDEVTRSREATKATRQSSRSSRALPKGRMPTARCSGAGDRGDAGPQRPGTHDVSSGKEPYRDYAKGTFAGSMPGYTASRGLRSNPCDVCVSPVEPAKVPFA